MLLVTMLHYRLQQGHQSIEVDLSIFISHLHVSITHFRYRYYFVCGTLLEALNSFKVPMVPRPPPGVHIRNSSWLPKMLPNFAWKGPQPLKLRGG